MIDYKKIRSAVQNIKQLPGIIAEVFRDMDSTIKLKEYFPYSILELIGVYLVIIPAFTTIYVLDFIWEMCSAILGKK